MSVATFINKYTNTPKQIGTLIASIILTIGAIVAPIGCNQGWFDRTAATVTTDTAKIDAVAQQVNELANNVEQLNKIKVDILAVEARVKLAESQFMETVRNLVNTKTLSVDNVLKSYNILIQEVTTLKTEVEKLKINNQNLTDLINKITKGK